MCGASVRKIIPVNRGDHHMLKTHRRYSRSDATRFIGVKSRRLASADIAERAGSRAGIAHDHHGGVLL
jgi:hypothetical protein